MEETWRPNVVVIGAGAMGCLFGGLLREGGLDVTLVDVWQAHVERINGEGLKILGSGGDRTIAVAATSDPRTIERADVVLVQCKANATATAVSAAKHLFRDATFAVSFQNGLGNEENIARVIGAERVLGGVTAQGASVVEAGVVRDYGDLTSHVGEMPGGITARAERVAAAFTAAGLQTVASADIRGAMWKKLMANVAVSPTCAVTNLSINDMIAVPGMLAVIYDALAEAVAVAAAEGVEVDLEKSRQVLDEITGEGGTGANKSSMCVDILNRRKTEIDVINGAIARLGEKHGIATPVNRTLVAAVKGLEQHCA